MLVFLRSIISHLLSIIYNKISILPEIDHLVAWVVLFVEL